MKPHEYMKEIFAAFSKRDSKKLRKLDDAILREASLADSKKLFHLAVISYVLSKILSKPRFLERQYAAKIAAIEKSLETISECTEECPEDEFLGHFTELEKAIKNLEASDARFVLDLLTKGRLKVAATLYAQGISLGTASEITGIEKQEILSYAGHTMMFDRLKEEKGVKDRLKALKALAEG
jgi:hypothetical protein